MRILVLGYHGQVARALRETASAHGVNLVALGRPELDLAHEDTIGRVFSHVRPDLVVNAAAYTAVDLAQDHGAEAYAVNAAGAGFAAAAAARTGCSFIHLSTDYVFDGTKQEPYVESDPLHPINVYGETKRAGEVAVLESHPDAVILRTSWIYAPWGRNFLRTMLRLAREGKELRVIDDQRGNPTLAIHIADGIHALARRLETGTGKSKIFHMAADGDASWYEFASAIFAASAARGGPYSRVIPIPGTAWTAPAPRPANSRLDCSKLSAEYDIRLPHWRAGLELCLDRLAAEEWVLA